MIAKILPIILQVGFVGAGVFVGLTLKPGADGTAETHADAGDHGASKKDGHGGKSGDKKKDGKKKKKKGGHGEKDGDAKAAASYIKFGRQFIVPVLGENGASYVVVFDVNIELPPNGAERAYFLEPKLRDAILQALFALANEGVLGADMLASSNLALVRERMLEASRSVLGEDARRILILNIARQKL